MATQINGQMRTAMESSQIAHILFKIDLEIANLFSLVSCVLTWCQIRYLYR